MKFFKKDDIITTYFKGIFKVTKMERRFKNELSNDLIFEGTPESYHVKYALNEEGYYIEASSLIYFIKIADDKGKKVKSTKEQFCDSAYCNLLEDKIDDIIKNLETQINNFKKIKDDFYNRAN